MGVQDSVTRLEDAKKAIIAAIEGKEVAVPAGTKLEGLAELIAAIEAGGVALGYATGTFTPTEDIVITTTNPYVFEHNCGFKPRAFFLCPEVAEPTKSIDELIYYFFAQEVTELDSFSSSVHMELATYTSYGSGQMCAVYTGANIYIKNTNWNEKYVPIFYQMIKNRTQGKMLSSKTYRWTAIGVVND